MARSQDRILGQSVTLSLILSSGSAVQIGEIDSASVTDKTKMLEHQPLGATSPLPQLVPGGWEVQCKGGKVDKNLSMLLSNNTGKVAGGSRDAHLLQGQKGPQFNLTITTTFYDGTTEVATYVAGCIYNYKYDATKADAEVTEDFTFSCAYRTVV